MCIKWDDRGLYDQLGFKSALDSAAMHAELHALWRKHKPWRHRRASFSHGIVGGYLGYVPNEAGVEMMAVVRKYFSKALEIMDSFCG